MGSGFDVVPGVKGLRNKLVSLHHGTSFASHFMQREKLHLLRQNCWWPSVNKDVDEYARPCQSCQHDKVSPLKPAVLLQMLPVLGIRWQRVSVDLITHLPMTKHVQAISVFVVAFRKMERVVPFWEHEN